MKLCCGTKFVGACIILYFPKQCIWKIVNRANISFTAVRELLPKFCMDFLENNLGFLYGQTKIYEAHKNNDDCFRYHPQDITKVAIYLGKHLI